MKMHKKCLAVLLIACCAALPAAGADTGETEPAGGNAQEERTADPSLTNQIEPYPAAEKLLPPLPAPPSSGQDVKAFLSYGKAVQAYVEAAQKYIDGATNDANAMDTVGAIKAKLAEDSKTFPQDMSYNVVIDNTDFIKASIEEVIHTFVEALLLVALIVFIFLQNWRATLIPMIAVPVSLLGTFASFAILGFTVNTLTLFAMVLAIGLVVDDAIVVIEAVEYEMRYNKKSPREASFIAMEKSAEPGYRRSGRTVGGLYSSCFSWRSHGYFIQTICVDHCRIGFDFCFCRFVSDTDIVCNDAERRRAEGRQGTR